MYRIVFKFKWFGVVLLTLFQALAQTTLAHGFKVGDIDIAHPYAIATVAGQPVGGVFFKSITNQGDQADRLIAASVDNTIATSTEIHVMNTENDVMRMRQIKAIELPAKTSVPMTRGLKKDGYHIMLMGLKAPLNVGEKIKLKLAFERAGDVDVVVNVEALKPQIATQHMSAPSVIKAQPAIHQH